MNYKAVLFDLDGTLLDTIEDLADSMNIVLDQLGLKTHSLEDYKVFVGDGMNELAVRVLGNQKINKELWQLCIQRMHQEYHKRWANKTKPYPQIMELLAQLKKLNIRMAVLSNKPDVFTQLIVKKYFPQDYFELVCGAKDNIEKKPDPAAALLIAQYMKIYPEHFLYLGDTNTDMQTACSAGMYPIGALWGFRTAKELKENGAKKLLEKPIQLLELIQND